MTHHRKKKRKKFTGKYKKLSMPIVLPPSPPLSTGTLLHTDEESKEIQSKYEEWKTTCNVIMQEELLKNLDLLFDYYGIERNKQASWIDLVFRLAFDNIPAFSVAEKPGRHLEWDDLRLIELNMDVKKIIKEKLCSARRACQSLARRKNDYDLKPRTLYDRYLDSNKSTFVMFLDAILSHPNIKDKDSHIKRFIDIIKKK